MTTQLNNDYHDGWTPSLWQLKRVGPATFKVGGARVKDLFLSYGKMDAGIRGSATSCGSRWLKNDAEFELLYGGYCKARFVLQAQYKYDHAGRPYFFENELLSDMQAQINEMEKICNAIMNGSDGKEISFDDAMALKCRTHFIGRDGESGYTRADIQYAMDCRAADLDNYDPILEWDRGDLPAGEPLKGAPVFFALPYAVVTDAGHELGGDLVLRADNADEGAWEWLLNGPRMVRPNAPTMLLEIWNATGGDDRSSHKYVDLLEIRLDAGSGVLLRRVADAVTGAITAYEAGK